MNSMQLMTKALAATGLWTALCSITPKALAKACHPMALAHCGLPWPSDTFTRETPETATGRTLDLPNELVAPEVLAQLPDSVRPASFSPKADGFAAASAVLFEIDGQLDDSLSPEQLAAAIEVIDHNSGMIIPVSVSISRLSPERRYTYLEAYPRTRWEFSHRYTAYLKKGLRLKGGLLAGAAPGIAHISEVSPSWVHQEYAKVLASQGLKATDILSITSFSIRSRSNVSEPLKAAQQEIKAFSHPLQNIRVAFHPHQGIAALIYGSFEALDFRDQDRGISYRGGSVAKTKKISFALALPESADQRPAPVAIYSHGLGFYKEAALIQIYQNAAKGYATLAIDHPYHGSHILSGEPYLLGMLAPRHLPAMVSLSLHITLDHLALLEALQKHLHTLDVLPQQSYDKHAPGLVRSDGIPDLDTSSIVFQGISLGGVMGASFVSMAPVKAAWFQVSGVGISRILSHSVLWNALFKRLVPKGASLGDVTLAMSAYQILQDYGDGINFLGELAHRRSENEAPAIGLVISKGDKIVPYQTGLTFARLLGLPTKAAEHENTSSHASQDVLIDVPAIAAGSFLEPYTAHFSFIRQESREALGSFLEQIHKP